MSVQGTVTPYETMVETGISGEPSIPYSLLANVDSRICPFDHMLDWSSPALDTRELALVNHVHGVVAGHITGPEEVRIAIGMRTLSELDAFDKATDEQIADRKKVMSEEDAAELDYIVAHTRRALGEDEGFRLQDALSNLSYEGDVGGLVPAILRFHSVDFSYPEGVIEDLSTMELKRTTSVFAVRKGLASYLGLTLRLTLDGLLTDRRLHRNELEVSLELTGSDNAITGKLKGIHSDLSGADWLEVSGDSGQRQRVPHNQAKVLGVTVTQPEVDNVVTGPDTPMEPTQAQKPRRKWFSRA